MRYSDRSNTTFTYPGSILTRTNRPRAAFTLLEVVVGIVLLASLVSGVVVATGAHQRKIRFARQKAVAVQFADELLSRWDRGSEGIPLSGSGVLAIDGSMAWQTGVIASRELCGIPVHVVRLSVVGDSDQQATVLCSVDLVVDANRIGSGQ